MQAVRYLLRSRQDLRKKSLSAALSSLGALSALQGSGNFSSQISAIGVFDALHVAGASLTTLSRHLGVLDAPSLQRHSLLDLHGAQAGETGWTRQTVYNIPNALSMARLVSGPAITWLILNEHWGVALVSLAISGASDWADGYVAKHYGQSSVLGSYLDPLADKVLIGCVVGALGYQGLLPWPLVALIIGRDVVLLSGAFVHRFKTVGWRWPGAAEFFRLATPPLSKTDSAAGNTVGSSQPISGMTSEKHSSNQAEKRQEAQSDSVDDSIASINSVGALQRGERGLQQHQSAERSQASGASRTPPAVFVQPLYISKVNTCFQLLLVSSCLGSSWYGWPPQEAILALGAITGGTTLASCAAYVRAYLKGAIK